MAKRCFVIQGFGKKQGYEQGKQFNLDASYDVIKEATRDAGMECYRADELRTSGTIDQVMYDQLLSADLVVADITTLNFNAAFELGVRLALRTNTHLEDAMEMEGSLMKPRLFIGSSSEKLLYAYALQNQLKSEADVTLWNQGFFALNTNYLESLINGLNDSDFAVFIFAPDDILNLRGETLASVRDNVLFELGLSMGKLGKERAFFILPEDHGNLRLPSDLFGISVVTFDATRDKIDPALGPACYTILQAIKNSGVRQERLPPSPIEIKIAQERERVRNICARIDGSWWERTEDGLGFFQIQMDELHSSVRLVQGRFYNETGHEVGKWNSVAARITEENEKVVLVYLRECRIPARDAKEWFHGYGDLYFEGSNEPFDQGHGMFFDVNREDPQKTLKIEVQLRRVHDETEIRTMQGKTDADIKALVVKVAKQWKVRASTP